MLQGTICLLWHFTSLHNHTPARTELAVSIHPHAGAVHFCLLQVDFLTVEIEHVDVDALQSAALQFKRDVEPTPHTLSLIQVKLQLTQLTTW